MAETKKKIDYSVLENELTSKDLQVYKSNYKKVVNYARWQTLFICGVIFLIATFAFIPVYSVISELGITAWAPVYPLLALLLLGSIYRGFIKVIKYRAKLYTFALKNGIKYQEGAPYSDKEGVIFKSGHSKRITEHFEMSDGVELGNYEYTTGNGKNSKQHNWGYARIDLPRKLPHMLLDAKSNNFIASNLPISFSKDQRMSLEGDFDKHFTLYAPEKYKRDALYVFAPDVMAQLIDEGSAYDMEVIDDSLYLYSSKPFTFADKATWHKLLGILNSIGGELREGTDYYADERVESRELNIIHDSGKRLQKSSSVIAVIVVSVIFFVFFFGL